MKQIENHNLSSEENEYGHGFSAASPSPRVP